MPKVYALCILALLLCSSASFADITPPSWSEFYVPRKTLSTGLLFRASKREKDNEYWDNRKNQFDAQVANCQQLESDADKINCFNQVRYIEQDKNNYYQNEVEADRTDRRTRLMNVFRPTPSFKANCTTFGNNTTCR